MTPKPFSSYIHYGPYCWEWMGTIGAKGYGVFVVNGHSRRAHRIAYETSNGPIADGLQICHRCDNRKCVRHDHLFAGTARDNQRDALSKGRHSSVKDRPSLDICKRGHELTPDNIYTNNGKNRCRACINIRSANWRSRQ